MNWNDVMGLIATLALSLPILTIIATGLAGYRTYPALVVYYSLLVIYNIFVQGYIDVDVNTIRYLGIANNLLDAPLMLMFLTYFASGSSALKQKMWILTGVFTAFEIITVILVGFNVDAITITMGPGILLILGFALPFFVRLTKLTITHHKATGKAMMTASMLFAYGCYTIIYVMYYLMKSSAVTDTFLVYFFVCTFSSLLMSAGIIFERKRIKKLSELKIVRRELSELYSQEKTAAPLKAAVFDFDKDQWN
jgi:hypothetical protein